MDSRQQSEADLVLIHALVENRDTIKQQVAQLGKALRFILSQPFEGDWDAQAVYIQHVLATAGLLKDKGACDEQS